METTLDTLLRGRLPLEQPARGHRFGVDSVILGAGLRAFNARSIIDLGTGPGTVALLAAATTQASTILGVDIQQDLIDIAGRNQDRNPSLSPRVDFCLGDVRHPPEFLQARFDLAVFNPPYFPANSGQNSPNSSRAISRHELNGTLDQLLTGARRVLTPQGNLRVIYPAEGTPRLFKAAEKAQLKLHALRPIHSRPEGPASFVLADLRAHGRREMTLHPPLVIYQTPDIYSPELERLMTGQHEGLEA